MSIPVVEGRQFMVGKYEIIARPIPYSAHMLRYTVYVDGKRIGALASMPTESDCLFLEKPPIVPPLKIYAVMSRPGRRKGSGKHQPPLAEKAPPPPREELPHGIIPILRDTE